MQLAIFYPAHKGIIFLMLPLTYEGLAGMKGLISIHYIKLDMYILAVNKPLKCDLQPSTAISNQSPCKSICTHNYTI